MATRWPRNGISKAVKAYPIDAILPALKEAVSRNPSVVLKAPAGSGKTTRVPLALLEEISPEKGGILMLEPRRLAAVSAARWMAQTIGEPIGQTLGYSIRFDRRVSKRTRIEVVTEGILLRRLQADPALEGVALVIFDEFHERGLNADLALALCLDIRRSLREDLKLLVMSATLDCGPVADLLGNAPVIATGGEAFPVEERYRPTDPNKTLEERITGAVLAALREASGDILVFLPGSGEIRSCSEALSSAMGNEGGRISIHPLYGDLPFEEQQRALLPLPKRKVVLATNIAETSLTIEGIKVVIDSGLTRRLQYDPSTGMNRLITVTVSRASAEQRKGRAGRTGPGVCYRLYRRHAFETMIPFAPPEILVADLSSLALELALWGVKDPAALSWLDLPPAVAWESARRLLKDLDALDSKGWVTPVGRSMAPLPLHPRLARLAIRGAELGLASLGADLASLLSERDIFRGRLAKARAQAENDSISERLDILRRWRKKKEIAEDVDPWALRAVDRAAQQILQLIGKERNDLKEKPEIVIPRLLLCAFPDRVAKRRSEGQGRFLLSQGRGVKVPAASPLAGSSFIVAVRVDAGEKTEGRVHLAEPISEDSLRNELGGRIETRQRVQWDKQEGRIISFREERLGQVLLSAKPFPVSDEQALPLLGAAIRAEPGLIPVGPEALQFLGRVGLMRKTFPEENWPDLSLESLLLNPENWLSPWLKGIRSREQLKGLDILPALQARLSREQRRLLDERAPMSLVVPSGHRVPLDYASGEIPVLAVKLQEMFGLADTPRLAGGRVRVLIHLLSPARRPVQITQDLKGFWESGYPAVKKDLKGRYPKHPWPDDPWNALPTRRTKAKRA